ncbi:MAG: DUF1249 domain-containing protein [Thiohalomonas sp.]|nr:DUF1249 domain-containing protein [Thiohalomonas sp.]
MAPEISELQVKDDLLLSASRIMLRILQQYKYTTLISLKQSLQTQLSSHLKTMTQLSAIDMELRICHDACLVEVIGYQGKSPIQSANVYPNKHMLQIDEKRQLNLFLIRCAGKLIKN